MGTGVREVAGGRWGPGTRHSRAPDWGHELRGELQQEAGPPNSRELAAGLVDPVATGPPCRRLVVALTGDVHQLTRASTRAPFL